MTAPTTLVELPEDLRSPLRREGNRALMIAWINADLLNRAGNDMRTSTILYDGDGLFHYALPHTDLPEELHKKLFDTTPARFYSKGI